MLVDKNKYRLLWIKFNIPLCLLIPTYMNIYIYYKYTYIYIKWNHYKYNEAIEIIMFDTTASIRSSVLQDVS